MPHPRRPQFTFPSDLCFAGCSSLWYCVCCTHSTRVAAFYPSPYAQSLKKILKRMWRKPSTKHNSEMVMYQGPPWLLTSCIPNDFLQIMQALFFFSWEMKYGSAIFHGWWGELIKDFNLSLSGFRNANGLVLIFFMRRTSNWGSWHQFCMWVLLARELE